MRSIYFYLIILAVFDIFILTLFLIYTKKIRKILKGKQASDLEDIIFQIDKLVKLNISETKTIQENIKDIELKLKKSIRGVGLVRFRAFNDVGGDQSFSLTLLDADLNGVIISSIYSREGVRVYSKLIEAGKSKHNLSNEEIESVKIAIKNLESEK